MQERTCTALLVSHVPVVNVYRSSVALLQPIQNITPPSACVSDLSSEPTETQNSEHWDITSSYQTGERKSHEYSHNCRAMQRSILGGQDSLSS